jgi:hypothetical protein
LGLEEGNVLACEKGGEPGLHGDNDFFQTLLVNFLVFLFFIFISKVLSRPSTGAARVGVQC